MILVSPKRARPSIPRLQDVAGGTHRGTDDFDMRAAATEIVAQCAENLRLRRMRIARKQRLGAHDHAVEAVAALRGLLVDEGLLNRIGALARTKTFQRHDVAA